MSLRLKVSSLPLDEKWIRDQRVMEEQDLEKLLDLWREWSQSNINGSGFKNRTIEHQLMIEGAVTRATGSHVLESPDCERLDAAISKMPDRMKKAVKLKYLFAWTNKDAAKAMKMSVPTYKQFTTRCRSWLCGKMTD